MKNCPLVAALTSNLLVIQLDTFDWNLIQSRIYNDILWVFTRCVNTIRLKVCIIMVEEVKIIVVFGIYEIT